MNTDALTSCQRCVLSTTRQRVVVGSGPSTPTLVVVGEAPGRTEDEGGEPFIGASGRLLFRLLEEATGLTRADCFVTNVVKCRPPQNRTPRSSEIEACRPWLDDQLAALRYRALVTLGNTAGKSVFGFSEGIATVHGTVFSLHGRPGLATYHPAAALRSTAVVNALRADLALLTPLVAA
jgi:uracil-DNA glycosylase